MTSLTTHRHGSGRTPLVKGEYDHVFAEKRRAPGAEVWAYVACLPGKPCANYFIDVPGIDPPVLCWQAFKYGTTGWLYYSMNHSRYQTNWMTAGPKWPAVPWITLCYDPNSDGMLIHPLAEIRSGSVSVSGSVSGSNGPGQKPRLDQARLCQSPVIEIRGPKARIDTDPDTDPDAEGKRKRGKPSNECTGPVTPPGPDATPLASRSTLLTRIASWLKGDAWTT